MKENNTSHFRPGRTAPHLADVGLSGTVGPMFDTAQIEQRLCALFDMDDWSVDAFLTRSAHTLGPARVGAALALGKAGRLTQRHHMLAGLAAMVVTTDLVGSSWLTRRACWAPDVGAHSDLTCPVWGGASVDDVLFGRHREAGNSWSTHIDVAGLVGADIVAGPHFGLVDLSRGSVFHASDLLADNVSLGETFTFSYDPGSRIDGVVVRRDSSQMVELDLQTCRDSAPAVADWLVGLLYNNTFVVFPGETATSEPLSCPLSPAGQVVETLHSWAVQNGVVEKHTQPWVTVGDVVHVLYSGGDRAQQVSFSSQFAYTKALTNLADRRWEEAKLATDTLIGASPPR